MTSNDTHSSEVLSLRERLRTLSVGDLHYLHGVIVGTLNRVRPSKPKPGSVSERLSAMAVGESILFETWTSPDKLGSVAKRYARRWMNDSNADWSASTTTKGVRVTRMR